MTSFGKHSSAGPNLGAQALRMAVESAAIDCSDVDALYVGHVYGGMVAGERVGALASLAGIPTVNIENAGASGSSAIIEAAHAISSGRYNCVAVCGFEKLTGSGGM